MLDASGRPSMRMHAREGTAPTIDLYNGHRDVMASLSTNGDGGYLSLKGPHNGSIWLSTNPSPEIRIIDPAGTPLASMALGDFGEPLVRLLSTDANLSAELRMDVNGAKPDDTYCEFSLNREVATSNEEIPTVSRSLIRLVARSTGGTTCELSDSNGSTILRVSVGDDGIPTFVCSGELREAIRRALRL